MHMFILEAKCCLVLRNKKSTVKIQKYKFGISPKCSTWEYCDTAQAEDINITRDQQDLFKILTQHTNTTSLDIKPTQ